VLDQFGRNLTAGAREGKLDPVIGREKEIERVMQVLSRSQDFEKAAALRDTEKQLIDKKRPATWTSWPR
jgi:protein-arginine kinase activator protein McsA